MKSASAQSDGPNTFTIGGIIDIGVGHATHALDQDASYPIGLSPVATRFGDKGSTGMFNGGLSASRLNFKGTENLGDGLRAGLTLETGFNPFSGVISNGPLSLVNNPAKKQVTVSADSSLAGQLFNREANVSLSSANWSISAGRNYSFGNDNLVQFDPMEGSSTFSPFGYSGAYGAGGSTEDYRVDNSLKFRVKLAEGVKAGLLYKFGSQSPTTGPKKEMQFNLGYESADFAIQGTYSSTRDAVFSTNSNTTGALDISVADTVAAMLAASYKINQWTLRGGYERIRFSNPSNPLADAGITNVFGYPVGAINLKPYPQDKVYDVTFAGFNYSVTPQFRASVATYIVKQNDFSNGACTGPTVASCSGNNNFYSVLGDYSLSKRTKLYAGYMVNRVRGGFAANFLHDSNNFIGTGIKHAF